MRNPKPRDGSLLKRHKVKVGSRVGAKKPRLFYGVNLTDNMLVPNAFIKSFGTFLGHSGTMLVTADLPVIEQAMIDAKTTALAMVWSRLYELVCIHGKIKVWLEV